MIRALHVARHARRRGTFRMMSGVVRPRYGRETPRSEQSNVSEAPTPAVAGGGGDAVSDGGWRGHNSLQVKGNLNYTIQGADCQLAEVKLSPGESVRAEAGAFIYLEDGVEMQTSLGGGLAQGLKRMMTGESLFITDFTNTATVPRTAAFGCDYPSKIIPFRIDDGGSIILKKGAFLCGTPDVQIEMFMTRTLAGGFFGGEGFVLQQINGTSAYSEALVKAGGNVTVRELESGEKLRISTGCLVGFEPTVSYDIQRVPGVRNILFGGEGLFVTTLEGPGRVWLESLPFHRLAGSIAGHVHSSGGGGGLMFPVGGGGHTGGEGKEGEGSPEAEGGEGMVGSESKDGGVGGGGAAAAMGAGMSGGGSSTGTTPESVSEDQFQSTSSDRFDDDGWEKDEWEEGGEWDGGGGGGGEQNSSGGYSLWDVFFGGGGDSDNGSDGSDGSDGGDGGGDGD